MSTHGFTGWMAAFTSSNHPTPMAASRHGEHPRLPEMQRFQAQGGWL